MCIKLNDFNPNGHELKVNLKNKDKYNPDIPLDIHVIG